MSREAKRLTNLINATQHRFHYNPRASFYNHMMSEGILMNPSKKDPKIMAGNLGIIGTFSYDKEKYTLHLKKEIQGTEQDKKINEIAGLWDVKVEYK